MTTYCNHTDRWHPRAGLAPLELVLSLPVLLFIMGLMIVMGTAGSWKVRTLANSRQSVLRTLWPRTGSSDPHPIGWPESATLDLDDGLPPLMANDPYVDFTVVRGPLLVDPETGKSIPVREELFEMKDGLRKGLARIQRDFPVMAKMPPHGIDMYREHLVLDNCWQYEQMNIPSNQTRRILFLYPVDLSGQIPDEIANYTQAVVAILMNPDDPVLRLLDRNMELRYPPPAGLSYSPPYGIGRFPDYHLPEDGGLRRRLLNPEQVCSMDPAIMFESVEEPLISEIQGKERPRSNLRDAGVPGRMTRDYLNMYQSHLDFIESLENILNSPNIPPGIVQMIQQALPAMHSQKASLETWIQQLERFRDLLVP